MAWIPAAATLGANLFAASSQKKAALKAGKAEANRLRFNASLADLNAEDALLRGNRAEYLQRLSGRKLVGSRRAAFAAQGVALDSGSALEVQEDTAMLIAYDALTIRNNAARESWGYQMQAQDLRLGAQSAKAGASGVGTSTAVQGFVQAYQLYRDSDRTPTPAPQPSAAPAK